MNKKILFALLLTIGLIVSACSSGSDDSESSGGDDSPVEIQYWYGLGSEADDKMQEIVSDFNDSQDDVVVTPVPQADYDETYQKLQAAVAANEAPAVFVSEISTLTDLANKDVLAPLDDFTEADEDFDESDFLSVLLNPGIIDDSTYGIPAYGTTQVMYYRKDIYEDAGIDPEEAFESWESLAEASKDLQDQDLVDFGHLPMWNENNLIDIAWSNDGQILNEDETEVLIDSPEWIDSWEFIREQLHEDETMKINSGGQGWEYWYKTIDQVHSGSGAGYTGSSGDKGDLDFDVIDAMPQPGLNGNEAKPNVDALYMGIPETVSDEEKEAAYKWISYFTSAEVNASWAQEIGYIPVKDSVREVPEYADYIEENPYADVPFEQALSGTPQFVDPTGGKIIDALSIAADKIELENISAEEALTEAKEVAQEALDKANE